MKLRNSIIPILLASLSGLAVAEDRVVFVRPGENVVVLGKKSTYDASCSTIPTVCFSGPKCSREDAAEVVKAMEILLRYAPAKYVDDDITDMTGSVLTWSSITTTRKTKADKLREEASAKGYAKDQLLEQARKLDEEQAEIEWARTILAKWKLKAS